MLRYIQCAFSFLALIVAAGTFVSAAQQNPKHLILKDGSYQLTTKWEIKGDRVRYFSTERYTWEEMPKDLVDWPATDKYNQEHEKERTISAADVAQQEAADQRALEAASPTVAPGLRLPDGGGIFLLDVFQKQPQLVELTQAGGEVNKQTGKNILRAAVNPLTLSSKQTIEIQGQHSKVQAHESQAAIYIDVDSSSNAQSSGATQPAGAQADHYRIIRLEPKKDSRVVGNLNVAIYGKVSQKENFIPTNSTSVGDWIKVTPAEPLKPGEYALVEMLDSKEMNIYVWDFGVNPDAPQNVSNWISKPQPTPGKGQGLEKRPN